MQKCLILSLCIFLTVLMVNCTNPLPVLETMSPGWKVVHMPTFTLTITGSDFGSNSKIVFNGVEKPTIFVSASELTCEINPEDIGSAPAMLPVLVRTPPSGGGDSSTLYFTVHENHTFEIPRDISISGDSSSHTDIEVDTSGNVFCVWDELLDGNAEIFFRRSTDEGETWDTVQNLSNNSGYAFGLPSIAVDSSGNINVAWSDITTGIGQIYFIRSTNGGTSWSSPVFISSTSTPSGAPNLVVDSTGNLNCVWTDYVGYPADDAQTFFSRSTDNGSTWSPYVNVSNNSFDSFSPAIAVDSSGDIYCVWSDESTGNFDIHFKRSQDNGVSWIGFRIVLNTWTVSSDPDIAIDNLGNINVVWSESPISDIHGDEIYFARSTDNGATWTYLNISNNMGTSWWPAIAVDSAGNINVFWYDSSSGVEEVYYSRSIDGGITWSLAMNIAGAGSTPYPAIAVDSTGNLYCAWPDYISPNWQIYFTRSTKTTR